MFAGPWGFKEIIIVAACIGVVLVALHEFGIRIPGWAMRMFWIVLCAFVAIFALRLLMSM